MRLFDRRDATKRELNLALPEEKFKHGTKSWKSIERNKKKNSGKYFHTVQIDTETYLAYLRQIFIEKGAQKQVADDFSIII